MSTPLARAQAKLDEIEIKEALISGCILSRMRNAQHRLRMERFCIPNSSCGPAIMIMRRLLEPQLPQRTRGTFGAANGTLRHGPPRRRRGVKPIEPRLRGAAVLFRWRIFFHWSCATEDEPICSAFVREPFSAAWRFHISLSRVARLGISRGRHFPRAQAPDCCRTKLARLWSALRCLRGAPAVPFSEATTGLNRFA